MIVLGLNAYHADSAACLIIDVKLVAGVHGGCSYLVGSRKAGITDILGLRGKTIGVADFASPDKNLYEIILQNHGLDPDKDVEDPIGGDLSLYQELTVELKRLIEKPSATRIRQTWRRRPSSISHCVSARPPSSAPHVRINATTT